MHLAVKSTGPGAVVAPNEPAQNKGLVLSARSPHAIDAHVGDRVRQRRTLLGMSQESLGERLKLSFQQVQKYERGANRISASRLYELGSVLSVPLTYFFDGLDNQKLDNQYNHETDSDPMNRRETLELVRAYYKISDETVRRRVYALVKSLGGDLTAQDSLLESR